MKTDGVSHDNCILDVKEHSRYDLSRIMDSNAKVTKLDIWERKLLDFSLRNSLLNLYLRQRAIQFITFDIALIEDLLQDGNEYVIKHKPETNFSIESEAMLVRSKTIPELNPLIADDIRHNTLHTYQPETETRNVLKNIYRASRNAIEETGANALYLAIGTLRWYETDLSEKPRYAPILMMPVEMVYKKGDFYIRKRDEEIALNITLLEFLRQNSDTLIPDISPLPTDKPAIISFSTVLTPVAARFFLKSPASLAEWSTSHVNSLTSVSYLRFDEKYKYSPSGESTGVTVQYQFNRYVSYVDGISAMLAQVGYRLQIKYIETDLSGYVELSAVPVSEYDSDITTEYTLGVTTQGYKMGTNHLICLGQGELHDRTVIHLYADANGNISQTKSLTGLDEIVETYENTSAESEQLLETGIERLKELLNYKKLSVSFSGATDQEMYIGDMVTGRDYITGVIISLPIAAKIMTRHDGNTSVEYRVEGEDE